MAVEEPQYTPPQGENHDAAPAQNGDVADMLASVLREVTERLRRQPVLDLPPEAQRAVAVFRDIREALRTPAAGRALAKDLRWNLPELNDTAKPRHHADPDVDNNE